MDELRIRNLRRFDAILALFVVSLSVYGLFVLYSAGRSASSPTPRPLPLRPYSPD